MSSEPITKEAIKIRNVKKAVVSETTEQKIARIVKNVQAEIAALNSIDDEWSYSLEKVSK